MVETIARIKIWLLPSANPRSGQNVDSGQCVKLRTIGLWAQVVYVDGKQADPVRGCEAETEVGARYGGAKGRAAGGRQPRPPGV